MPPLDSMHHDDAERMPTSGDQYWLDKYKDRQEKQDAFEKLDKDTQATNAETFRMSAEILSKNAAERLDHTAHEYGQQASLYEQGPQMPSGRSESRHEQGPHTPKHKPTPPPEHADTLHAVDVLQIYKERQEKKYDKNAADLVKNSAMKAAIQAAGLAGEYPTLQAWNAGEHSQEEKDTVWDKFEQYKQQLEGTREEDAKKQQEKPAASVQPAAGLTVTAPVAPPQAVDTLQNRIEKNDAQYMEFNNRLARVTQATITLDKPALDAAEKARLLTVNQEATKAIYALGEAYKKEGAAALPDFERQVLQLELRAGMTMSQDVPPYVTESLRQNGIDEMHIQAVMTNPDGSKENVAADMKDGKVNLHATPQAPAQPAAPSTIVPAAPAGEAGKKPEAPTAPDAKVDATAKIPDQSALEQHEAKIAELKKKLESDTGKWYVNNAVVKADEYEIAQEEKLAAEIRERMKKPAEAQPTAPKDTTVKPHTDVTPPDPLAALAAEKQPDEAELRKMTMGDLDAIAKNKREQAELLKTVLKERIYPQGDDEMEALTTEMIAASEKTAEQAERIAQEKMNPVSQKIDALEKKYSYLISREGSFGKQLAPHEFSVKEPGIRGDYPVFSIQGDKYICTNYSGSLQPMDAQAFDTYMSGVEKKDLEYRLHSGKVIDK